MQWTHVLNSSGISLGSSSWLSSKCRIGGGSVSWPVVCLDGWVRIVAEETGVYVSASGAKRNTKAYLK